VVDVLLGNLWRLLYHQQGAIQDFFWLLVVINALTVSPIAGGYQLITRGVPCVCRFRLDCSLHVGSNLCVGWDHGY